MKKILSLVKRNWDIALAVVFPFLLIAAVFSETRCSTALVPGILAGLTIACFLLIMLPFGK